MQPITVQIAGLEQALANLDRVEWAMQQRMLGRACAIGAQVVRNHAQASMREPKSGRTYKRGNVTRAASRTYAGVKGLKRYTTAGGKQRVVVGSKLHRASAPGEAPAVDYGNLINSFSVVTAGEYAVLRVTADYAAALEFGTARVAPRPFIRPAIDNHKAEIADAISAAIEAMVRKAVGA